MRKGIFGMVLTALVFSGMALADLEVRVVSVTSLPFNLSPNNFANSASNFKNSISNFSNSGSNFNNSASNFENAKSNFKNSASGSRRLIYEGRFAGYYVSNSAGVLNVFSASGNRVMFNPSGTSAVFTYEGDFAGVLALSGSKLVLALTNEGIKVLLLN